MTRQETTYNKDTFKITSYKEFFNDELLVHHEYKPNGNKFVKLIYDNIETYFEYDNKDRRVLETIPLGKYYFRYSNEIRIPYKTPNKQYLEAYYQIIYKYSVNDNYKICVGMSLILIKKLDDKHNLRIIKYLDK